MNIRKTVAASAAVLMGSLALAACGDNGGSGDGDGSAMTFWHNSTTGDGRAYWDATAAAFEADNPGVTIEIQAIQNEDMDDLLQTALNSGDAPDIFMARGGGKLADVVDAGQAQDLSDLITQETRDALGEAAFNAFTIDGAVYGMPLSVLPGGIYYNQELFDQAGITQTPTTMAELVDVVETLKGAGIDPIALGAQDAWPAAHWYYFFALRQCSQDTMTETASTMDFSDACWLAAGEDMADFASTEPFNRGFLTTTSQQGAGSSAGLIANGQAAMELMGAWQPGVIADLTPDGEPLEGLGWFPFPAIDGGDGAPGAMMGGVDGFSCSAEAPPACADFLNFAAGQTYQEGYAEAFQTLPANQDAQGVVTTPALLDVLAAYNEAPYVTLWLDTMYGAGVGNALNTSVVNLLAGGGSAQDIVDGVATAASRG